MRQARRRDAAGSVGARVVAGKVVCASARALPRAGSPAQALPVPDRASAALEPARTRDGGEAGPVDRAAEAGAHLRGHTPVRQPTVPPTTAARSRSRLHAGPANT
jgi:hypothetical protein